MPSRPDEITITIMITKGISTITIYNLVILSHHSVDESGDENGKRFGFLTRNPLSSPFSFTVP